MKEKHLKGRYWCFLENIDPSAPGAASVELFFALPVNHSGQRVKNLRIVPAPSEVIEDDLNGNRFLIWKSEGTAANISKIYYYDFDLYCSEVNRVPDPESITPYDVRSEEYRRNTISEGWLDISEDIVRKASEIVAGEVNSCRKAKLIYDWVSANITYEYTDPESRGASKTLKRRKGDCGEFSSLFVSLCRASGIPARPVTANWVLSGGHQWAEVLLPPYGWVPVDATVAHFFKSEPEGRVSKALRQVGGFESSDPDWCFGNLYPDRIIVQIGENAVLPSGKRGKEMKTFHVLQPGGQDAIPPAVELKGFGAAVQCGTYVFGANREDRDFARIQLRQSLGEALLQVNAFQRAVEELRPVALENPGQSYAWLLLGKGLFGMREYGAALDALKKSIAGDGGSLKPVWDAQAGFLVGNILDILGDRGGALKEYEKVISSGVSFENLQGKAGVRLKSPYTDDLAVD